MARFPRIVVPGVPHHVTQRGARKMKVFFTRADYRSYIAILARQAESHALDLWAYCLMPNHVHLIVVPATERGLSRPIGEAHRRYATLINRREGWTGHLWQERFASFPMDEPHLVAAIRYVLLNPVRAGLVETATDWPHSSARAHVLGMPDKLVNCAPATERVPDWPDFLSQTDSSKTKALRLHGHTGRPLGSDQFIAALERVTGRRLRPRRVGPKPTAK